MQVIVHYETKQAFDEELKALLNSGWKVVPGTYSATSRQNLSWNVATQKTDMTTITNDFFIVVEKDKQTIVVEKETDPPISTGLNPINRKGRDEIRQGLNVMVHRICYDSQNRSLKAMLPLFETLPKLIDQMDQLEIALHDAICRPMGVVPRSAEPFVTEKEMEAAKTRRPHEDGVRHNNGM
jgi:hypothetical protein